LILDSGTPTQTPVAQAESKSSDPTQDAGSKVAIDEELKKAKEAAEKEDRKNGIVKPVAASAQTGSQIAGNQPVAGGTAGPVSATQSPLPPGVRRDNQDGALYEKALSKAGGGAGARSAAVTGNGRGGDDFEIEAQVRGSKSIAFDESQAGGAGQAAQTAMVLAGFPAVAGANSAQKALANLPELAAGSGQAPSASMASSIDRLMGNLKSAPGGIAGRPQGGGSGNSAWVNEYASNTGQRASESIKSYPTTSPYTLHQGKVIPAVLGRQINSDLPGEITAYVVTNVYDSLGNGALLIPKGSVLAGRYNSEVKPGQERVLFAFNRLIMPNGQSFDLPGAQGSDLAGASGITGDVDNHFFKMFSTSFFTAWLTDRVTPVTTTNGVSGTTSQVSPAGQVLVDVSKTILERNRTIPPTITVDQGTRINVEVKKDMEFSGPYSWSKK
jgi:type IV secretory pathway VirB10-like protein